MDTHAWPSDYEAPSFDRVGDVWEHTITQVNVGVGGQVPGGGTVQASVQGDISS